MQRLLAILILCGSAVHPAWAQVRGSGDGYLFGAPTVRLSGRVGYAHANAGSDLFTDLTNQFILSKRDFSSVALGGEVGYQVAPRLELALSVDYAGSRKGSEYRHLVDNNNQPIEQTTRFERVPIMANARVSLVSPGRQVGRLAWIPSRIVPWIGGGAGAIWYRLNQTGDFVDASTNTVGFDELGSDGWTMAGQVMGGVDVGITPRLSVTTDVRSIWARAALDRDFSGFERLDLSGVSATLGLTIRL
jgi:hypothetical protein